MGIISSCFGLQADSQEPPLADETLKAEPYTFQPGVFQTLASPGNRLQPQPRINHCITVDKHYVYTFGGYNPLIAGYLQPIFSHKRQFFSELWRFSKITRSWSFLKTSGQKPIGFIYQNLYKIGNNLVLFGCSPVGLITLTNELHVLNLETLNWTHLKAKNSLEEEHLVPNAWYGQAVALDRVNLCFYVSGGRNWLGPQSVLLNIYRFDLSTMKWSIVAHAPEPYQIIDNRVCGPRGRQFRAPSRYGHAMALWNNKLMLIGGRSEYGVFSFKKILQYDLFTKVWEVKLTTVDNNFPFPNFLSIPENRSDFSSVQEGSNLYLAGGQSGILYYEHFPGKIWADVWCFHLPTLTWRYISTLPRPVHSTASAYGCGKLTIFGGQTVESDRTSEIYEAWMTVPRLEVLATEAVLHGMRQKLESDEEQNGCTAWLGMRKRGPNLTVKKIEKYIKKGEEEIGKTIGFIDLPEK